MHPLLAALQTAIFKLEVLLSIFCDTKITLEWTTPSFLDLPPPNPIMPHPTINIQIFSAPLPLFSILKTYGVFKWGGGGGGSNYDLRRNNLLQKYTYPSIQDPAL